jgi:small multidrug resistance pump
MIPLLLAGAIVSEVVATIALRMVVKASRWWIPAVVVGYGVAFLLLVQVLSAGTPIGVAYGIWTAGGVILTAVAGRFLFREPLTWMMGAGMALIVGGVLLIEIGAHP